MGLPLVSPIVNAANFIILSYNFAGISEVMPMELYIPVFVITIGAMLLVWETYSDVNNSR